MIRLRRWGVRVLERRWLAVLVLLPLALLLTLVVLHSAGEEVGGAAALVCSAVVLLAAAAVVVLGKPSGVALALPPGRGPPAARTAGLSPMPVREHRALPLRL